MKKKLSKIIIMAILLLPFHGHSYYYLKIGGSLLYPNEITNKDNILNIMRSYNDDVGFYASIGSIAQYNAGYELEAGYLKIKKTKIEEQDGFFAINAPYIAMNYVAMISLAKAINLYIGAGVGRTKVTAETLIEKNFNTKENIFNLKEISNAMSEIKTIIQSEVYSKCKQSSLYQLIFGTNFKTGNSSMISIDYRYKISGSEIPIQIKNTQLSYEHKIHSFNIGINIIL